MMASDVVERLRSVVAVPHGADIWTVTALEAADEIERLRQLLRTGRALLALEAEQALSDALAEHLKRGPSDPAVTALLEEHRRLRSGGYPHVETSAERSSYC